MNDEPEGVRLQERGDRTSVEITPDQPSELGLHDEHGEVVEQFSQRCADGLTRLGSAVRRRDRGEAGEADVRTVAVDDGPREFGESGQEGLVVRDLGEQRTSTLEVLTGRTFDAALLRCGDQSVPAPEMMADETDGDLGLRCDIGDPKTRLAAGVKMRDSGREQALSSLCGATIDH